MTEEGINLSTSESKFIEKERFKIPVAVGVIVPWLLSLVTVLVGVFEFRDQQIAAGKRPFLEQQLALTLQASDDAAVLSTTTDQSVWDATRKDFDRLYFGKLVIVEDPGLATAMFEFHDNMPLPTEKKIDLPRANLQPEASEIAKAGRALISKSWGVDLGSLDPPRK